MGERDFVVGCEDCENEKRQLPTVHLHIVPNYGPQALPTLVLSSERGTIRLPLSSAHRQRLTSWGVPTRKRERDR
jgi:hypothetical protein